MFSRRADWDAQVNRLTLARKARATRGEEILDLTVSNPTRAGLQYPLEEIAEAFARAARAPYDPQPLGLPLARQAVARSLGCQADSIVITASTSEAYSFLFKLLIDRGDHIVTARPSYPLLDHLVRLELGELRHFPLEFHGRWEIVRDRVAEAVTAQARALVAVSPNNPTGSYVRPDELRILASFGRPLIIDEVFREFAFGEIPPPTARDDVLTFSLGGLSKSAGMPHFKLGWIRVSGPGAERDRALAGLELIADNFLSVATPVQQALPELLRIGQIVRESIRARTLGNLMALQQTLPPSATLLPVEGGWAAVLRVVRTRSDEELALALLDQGVVVYPGYLFDFEEDGFIVVSLLTHPDVFAEGLRRIIATLNA